MMSDGEMQQTRIETEQPGKATLQAGDMVLRANTEDRRRIARALFEAQALSLRLPDGRYTRSAETI
jgi:hypothetical protein